jgi:hypothetical protein
MPGPARKRQKTVHKVAELEKKINALTDALISQQQANPTPPKSNSPTASRDPPTNTSATSDPNRDLERLNQYDRDLVARKEVTFEQGDLDWGCSKWNKILASKDAEEPYVDIIDRGLLDIASATRIFDYYVSDMLPHFPLLAFPPTIFAQDVRTARPMLFLAILVVASPSVKPEIHQNLTVELTRQLSERVLFLGEKSLEIVQAILVHTSCYSRSKYAKDLTFNQLIHSAVVMCLDLGMGKRYKKLDRDSVEEAEIRRTWMACYYFASNVSILLRHPSLVRWTPYLEESCDYFLKSPDSVDKDRWLCAMVQTQRMAEEISVVFNMDDPSSTISFGDTSTQYQLKAFEKQLASWPETVPSTINKHISQHMAASLNLYLHEIAIHHDHNVDDFRPDPDGMDKSMDLDPITRGAHKFDSGSFVTTRHIDALSKCLDACHQVLDNYLALPIQVARSISNLGIVWNTYAAVALIKLHGVLHAPDSKFGSIFTPNLKVEWYLDSFIHRLQEVSADGRCPPAEAFVYVVHKLRHWFQHKHAPHVDPEENDVWGVIHPNANEAHNKKDANNIMKNNNIMKDLSQGYSLPPEGLPDRVIDLVDSNDGRDNSGSLNGPNIAMVGAQNFGNPSTSRQNSLSQNNHQQQRQQQQQQQTQQSQPLIGTSSMPASQLDPTNHQTSNTQNTNPLLANGGFPSSAWSSAFSQYEPKSQFLPTSQQLTQTLNPQQQGMSSDLNVAYNAQNYNIDWSELQFGRGEMEVFDEFMGERGWMGYLI